MATKKKKEQTWDGDSIQEYMHSQFVAKAVKGEYHDAAQVAASDIGIRLPHLCLRFMFQRTTFPFERTTLLFGPPKSNKSSFLFWIYNLFRLAGGRYMHVELEDKDAALMRLAMTGYSRSAGWARACESMDVFQQQVMSYLDWFYATCAKGPGRRVPFVVGVDSLVAKMTAEAQRTMVNNDGAATRRFADEARSLSDWFKFIPTYLQGWPVCLVAINHDKPVPGQMPGQLIHKTPGGSAPNYYATYKVLLQKVKTIPQQATGWEANRIKFSLESSSLGADKLGFEAEIGYRTTIRHNAKGNEITALESVWNFDKATTECLYRLSEQKKGARGNAVDDVLGLSKSGARYTCQRLDIRGEDALPPSEMGRLLESRPDVLAELEPRLGIHQSREFDPADDFGAQLAAARAAAEDLIPVGPDPTMAEVDDAGGGGEGGDDES